MGRAYSTRDWFIAFTGLKSGATKWFEPMALECGIPTSLERRSLGPYCSNGFQPVVQGETKSERRSLGLYNLN